MKDMTDEEQKKNNVYIDRIATLEKELALKNKEITQFKEEILRANEMLEAVIADLSQELKYAGLMQKVLSPTKLPHLNGLELSMKFVPGSKSGGDYFDIYELNQKMRFGMIMASSSGYAMSALFLSVLIKMSAQLESKKAIAPDLMISSIIKDLLPHIGEKDKSSVFYGLLDLRHFEFSYCGVGDVHVFHFSHNQLTPLPPSTGPIHKNYMEQPLIQTLSLSPRDRIIVCTDGLFSATNLKGEAFGSTQLSKSIQAAEKKSVHDLRNEILFQVGQWVGQQELPRDQTILIAEVRDQLIHLAKSK